MHPAAHVHLVHRDGLLERVAVVALLQPGVIAPLIALEVGHHRGLSGAHLVLEAVGVGLLVAVPLLGVNLVFVMGASTEPRHKQFPDAADPLLHRQVAAIPVGAVANHRDTAGVGGPQAELHPSHTVLHVGVGPHPLPDVVMVAFGKQVPVHGPHPLLAEGVGVVLFVGDPGALDAQAVVGAGIAA